MKLWSFTVKACRRGGVEVWSSYGMLRARGRGGVYLKRSGAGEAFCGPGDVASKEIWRCAAGVQTWRYRGMKPWSSGGRLQSCRRGGVCLKRSGAHEACCGPGDVEEA